MDEKKVFLVEGAIDKVVASMGLSKVEIGGVAYEEDNTSI